MQLSGRNRTKGIRSWDTFSSLRLFFLLISKQKLFCFRIRVSGNWFSIDLYENEGQAQIPKSAVWGRLDEPNKRTR